MEAASAAGEEGNVARGESQRSRALGLRVIWLWVLFVGKHRPEKLFVAQQNVIATFPMRSAPSSHPPLLFYLASSSFTPRTNQTQRAQSGSSIVLCVAGVDSNVLAKSVPGNWLRRI